MRVTIFIVRMHNYQVQYCSAKIDESTKTPKTIERAIKRVSKETFDTIFNNTATVAQMMFTEVFFGDSDYLVDAANKTFRLKEIQALLNEKGIGIFDTATAIRRLSGNASDKDLDIVEKTDIPALLKQMPLCHDLVCTGQKSFSVITEDYGVPTPMMGKYNEFMLADRPMRLWRMPSSSRAFPMKLPEKASYYRSMMLQIGLI